MQPELAQPAASPRRRTAPHGLPGRPRPHPLPRPRPRAAAAGRREAPGERWLSPGPVFPGAEKGSGCRATPAREACADSPVSCPPALPAVRLRQPHAGCERCECWGPSSLVKLPSAFVPALERGRLSGPKSALLVPSKLFIRTSCCS